jgi:D-alanyl-lipoteichoic acid acyltransferase DltB (MBOAT superfamily)
MLFPTLTFHIFFVVTFALIWLCRDNEWRKILLLVASWIFYGAWDWRFVALLIASGVLNWAVAELILAAKARARDGEGRPGMAKLWLVFGVIANLTILGFFKYYGFFLEQLIAMLHSAGWERDIPIMEVILPVGVSFFTFQGMSYQIDVYRDKTERASLLDITLLMSFFPHLVAGPIVRASHLVPQFRSIPKLTLSMAAAGVTLILWGLFKKTVIASELATNFVDPVFFDPSAHGSLDLLLGAYGYAVQIYCDFSAYSDMAVGLAALLGYRFPWNFNQPYRAATLQDFWRRWHISLSQWLRDYLYISLGGSRHGTARLYFALSMTMLLGGLWHGASWNFVIWGAIHGAVLVAERIWWSFRQDHWPKAPHWLSVILTFHIVTLAWIFFRSAEFGDAMAYLEGIAALRSGAVTATPLMLLLIIVGMSFHYFPRDGVQRVAVWLREVPAWRAAVLSVAALVLLEAMRPDGVAPFIYYQF